jgi:hypothetical protein
MGVVAKHNYRAGFLKSEFWRTMRERVITEHSGRCFVCGVQNYTHDVHHIFYPKNPYDIKAHQLFALCRRCHDLVHEHTNPGKMVNYRHGFGIFISTVPKLREITGDQKPPGATRRICTDRPPPSTAKNPMVEAKIKRLAMAHARPILYPEMVAFIDAAYNRKSRVPTG